MGKFGQIITTSLRYHWKWSLDVVRESPKISPVIDGWSMWMPSWWPDDPVGSKHDPKSMGESWYQYSLLICNVLGNAAPVWSTFMWQENWVWDPNSADVRSKNNEKTWRTFGRTSIWLIRFSRGYIRDFRWPIRVIGKSFIIILNDVDTESTGWSSSFSQDLGVFTMVVHHVHRNPVKSPWFDA